MDDVAQRKLRVLHVISGLLRGGAERMLVSLLQSLSDRCDHAVLALVGGPIREDLRAAKVPLCELSQSGTIAAALHLPAAWAYAKQFDADVIHGWMYNGNLLAQLLAKRLDVPCVWAIHQTVEDVRQEKLGVRLALAAGARWSRHTSRTVFVSERGLQQHVQLGFAAERACIVPNGFDVARLQRDAAAGAAFRQRIGAGPDLPLVGLVARYHPMKDQRNFLRAAALVAAECPQALFVLVGRDVEAPASGLAAEAAALGIAERVTLVGEVGEIVAVMSALDVLCLSSSAEAFPIVLGEALACGTPCVTTDVGDAARVVGPGGSIVPPRDSGSLARALSQMLQKSADERRAVAAAGRDHITRNFGLDRIAGEYMKIYETALAAHATRQR
jgi:glycosyltransferase involved in cell wall biosynthesis